MCGEAAGEGSRARTQGFLILTAKECMFAIATPFFAGVFGVDDGHEAV